MTNERQAEANDAQPSGMNAFKTFTPTRPLRICCRDRWEPVQELYELGTFVEGAQGVLEASPLALKEHSVCLGKVLHLLEGLIAGCPARTLPGILTKARVLAVREFSERFDVEGAERMSAQNSTTLGGLHLASLISDLDFAVYGDEAEEE